MQSTEASGSEPRRRYTKNGKYWFDAAAGDAAVDFFPTYLRHTEGEWAGQPFYLSRSQRRIVRKIFGWKRRDGTRRYRKLWLEVPRKWGKTEFAAGIALLLLIADGEMGGQIYSVAREENQASIVFRKAAKMVGLSESLSRDITAFKTSLYCDALMAAFMPLSAAPLSKHGFSPSGLVADEVHAWDDGELAETVHEGMGARRQPLEVYITTAGKRDTYAWEQHEYAIGVQKGEIEDDEMLVVIYAADDEDDWTDPNVWAKANPHMPIGTPKREFLEAECRRARQIPRLQNNFRRYYLNQWVEQTTRWLPMEFWDVCSIAPSAAAKRLFNSDPERDPSVLARVNACGTHDPALWTKMRADLKGRTCFGGLDLATVSDLAALAWMFPPQEEGERTKFLWRCWLPQATYNALKETDQRRYKAWVDAGALTLTPGNVTDYSFIKQTILEDAGFFRLVTLGVDRFNATQLVVDLLNDNALPVELFGQGFVSMSAPSKEFEREILGLEIEHGNNPIARFAAKNVAIDQDPHENIKPVKPKKNKAGSKVDPIIAAVIARGVSMGKKEARSIYEKRGILRLG